MPLVSLARSKEIHSTSWKLMKKTMITQPAYTCSKLTIERLEQGVKYVQS